MPKRLLMGPWSHMNPIDSIPGPRIDHVRELIRWFDRWLRGVENGIDREPPIVLFALDREGVVTHLEGSGLEAAGLRPGEAVGRSAFELYDDYPKALDFLRRNINL